MLESRIFNIFHIFYSVLKASIGFNLAALYAGNIPKIIPIALLAPNANNTIEFVYINVYSNK